MSSGPSTTRPTGGEGKVRVLRGTGGYPRLAAGARPAVLRPAPSRQAAVSRRTRNPEAEPRVAATRGNRSAGPGSPGSVRPPRPTRRRRPPPPAPLTRTLEVVAGLHGGSLSRLRLPGPAPPPFRAAACPGVSAARADWARPTEPPQTPPSPGPDCGREVCGGVSVRAGRGLRDGTASSAAPPASLRARQAPAPAGASLNRAPGLEVSLLVWSRPNPAAVAGCASPALARVL